jgi:DNA modification methylase
MKTHEVANLFPLMTPEEFTALKADIQANGLREPVWTWQGKVIDGRNRLRACEELGITPPVREWDGKGSLVAFVVSLNLHRRHLTGSQRAALGVEVEPMLAKEAKKRQRAAGGDKKSEKARANGSVQGKCPESIPAPQARDEAAKLTQTHGRYVQAAKKVKAEAPELFEKVKNGKMTLPQARTDVKRQQKRKEMAAKAAAAPPNGKKQSWEIRHGDCLAELEKVKTGTVRLAFADPPYNVGIDYGGGKKADQLPRADYLAWCGEWMKAVARTLTSDGSFWVLINDESAAEFKLALEATALTIRQWLIWYETFGVNHANGFNRTHRHLFWAVKNSKRFVFNADAVNRPSDRQAKYDDARADPGGKNWDSIWGVEARDKDGGIVLPAIPRLTATCEERLPDFPTQLPLALLCPVVGCATDPGDLVLDPFSGSATTGAAAIRAGRRYLGIEKSKDYLAASEMRLKGIKQNGD